MNSKILINAVDPEVCRIAKIKKNKLEEFNIENAAKEITRGNIYKGIVTRIEPGLQSAFVDYGAERNGFLQMDEIHRDYFQDDHSGAQSIQKILKRGQELFVQVTKDPIMSKGAMLTTFISLAGRSVVLMPGSEHVGVSRKIEDEAERKRLKDLIESMELPEGFGLIVRTAGINCTKTTIGKDLRYLLRLWKNINKKGVSETAPALLFKERNLAVRVIRDTFTTETNEIIVDNQAIYNEIRDFVQIVSPKHKRSVKLYRGEEPIFSKYQIEQQIVSIYEKRVALKSGGGIVIDPTEALVAIDVNSGKATRNSIEQTAFKTNMEAAEEIARQLRLRDLGGLIVVDFIDMKESSHKTEVEKAMKTNLKEDKARTKVGRISKFGLLEISRQRISPPIEFGSYEHCQYCQGKGMMPTIETLGLSVLRKLKMESAKGEISLIRGILPPKVADYLLNRKRKEILELETKYTIQITIESKPEMMLWENEISVEKKS